MVSAVKEHLRMDTVTLRRFQKGDEFAVSDVICTTLAISNRKDYSPEFIKENIKSHSPKIIAARAGEAHFYVAMDGETISWEYLCYVRKHPIKWSIPTCILYGGNDHLTSRETISGFADRIGADLTVMEDGEHWFHTAEQMKVLDHWISNSINSGFITG